MILYLKINYYRSTSLNSCNRYLEWQLKNARKVLKMGKMPIRLQQPFMTRFLVLYILILLIIMTLILKLTSISIYQIIQIYAILVLLIFVHLYLLLIKLFELIIIVKYVIGTKIIFDDEHTCKCDRNTKYYFFND